MQELAIHLLGRPRIELDGEPIGGKLPVKGLAMVCYVAAMGCAQSRAAIASLLWGALPAEAGRANLRLTLTRSRQVLGHALAARGTTIGLDERLPTHVDLHRFRATSARVDEATLAELEASAAGIDGSFLDELELSDAPAFDSWAESERLQTHREAGRLWERIRALREANGDRDGAIAAARIRVQLDPWDESAQRELIRLLADSGRPIAAVAQFENFCRTLAEDLGTRPGPGLRELVERIGDRPARPPAMPTSAPQLAEIRPIEPMRGASPDDTAALVGRENTLDAIEARLLDPDCRALMLLGPGGIGKTRLAQAIVERVGERFRNGAVLATPTSAASANADDAVDRVVASLTAATSLVQPGPGPIRETLLDALANRECLLVIDNAEAIRGAAAWLAALIRRAPAVRLMLASRERLGLPQAWLFDVPGLPAASAAALFTAVARTVRADFDETSERPAIDRICALVQGSPLAVELAARRAHTLSCTDIAERLAVSLDLLSGGDAAVPRHASMSAVLDDSWAALAPELRDAAARLAVFDDEFDACAAAAVARVPIPQLADLIDRSWLAARGARRFAMHALVRHYARDRLATKPDEARALRAAHAGHFRDRFAAEHPALIDDPEPAVIARLDPDAAELRAAIDWAQNEADTATLVDLLEAAWPWFERKGWFDRIDSVLVLAQRRPDLDPVVRARWLARRGLGQFLIGHGPEADELGTAALSALGERPASNRLGWYLAALASPLRYRLARRREDRAVRAERARIIVGASSYVGQHAYLIGDLHRSLGICLRTLPLLRDAGPGPESARMSAAACFMLGLLGADPLCRRLMSRALESARESHSGMARAHALSITGLYRITRGEWYGLDADLAEALALYRGLGQARWAAETASMQGKALYLEGRLDEAAASFERNDREARDSGNALGRHWCTLGFIECGMRAGRLSTTEALERLEELRRQTSELAFSDPAEIIRFHGLNAVFGLRAGNRSGARAAVGLAASVIARTRLCGFWAIEGYSGAIETALALAPEEPSMADTARTIAAALRRLAPRYPILRGRARWMTGVVAKHERRDRVAARCFDDARALARRWHAGLDQQIFSCEVEPAAGAHCLSRP